MGVIIEGSDYYWKWRWKALKRKGKMIYENIDKHHPIRAWTLIPNLRNKLHHAAAVNSNSKGVRGIREKFTGKNVLFYGVSFCFGEGVDDDETIPSFFESNLKGVSSINLGIHGYAIDQQYLYLKETISKYKPLLTCFIITDNDFRRNFMDFRDFAKPMFVLKKRKLILKNIPVPKPEEYLKMKEKSMFVIFMEFIKHFFIYYGLIGKKKRTLICDKILDKIKENTDKYGSEIVFVYVSDPRRGFWYRNYIDNYFINYFKKRNIKYLHLKEMFGRKRLNEMFGTLTGHFTKEGNGIVAKKLIEFVKSEGLLK